MPFRNDGGNFSNDQIIRMLAMKQGSMNEDELARQEAIPQQAIDMASGVMGTVQGPAAKFGKIRQMLGGAEEAAAAQPMGMADKIKMAAEKSGVKWEDLPSDAEKTMFQQRYKDAPSFFEKYGPKPEEPVLSDRVKKLLATYGK